MSSFSNCSCCNTSSYCVVSKPEDHGVGADLREFVIDLNTSQSKQFSEPGARLLRQAYHGKHPTQILALKCMDGRLNLSVMTETPFGIIIPFRNIGGRFDLGWPFFGEVIYEEVQNCVTQGRDTIVFVTYHFSKGATSRGCAGFEYNTKHAHESADILQKQFETVFGRTVVFPIVVGIETDEEGLLFHKGQKTYDIEEHCDDSIDMIQHRLLEWFPDMNSTMRNDLVPLIIGNQRHVQNMRVANRPCMELDHMENIIGVGGGFSWFHVPNKALLIGPYSHEWPSAVETAGKIVLSNIEAGRTKKEDGVLLLVSARASAEKGSSKWRIAEEKARYYHRTALQVLQTRYPEIIDMLSVVVGVVDSSTMLLHPLSEV